MGFLDALSEVLADATKAPISTLETFQDYWDDIQGVLAADSDYIALFDKAIRNLSEKRSQDVYLQSIMNRTAGRALSAVEIRDSGTPTEHFSVWRVYYGDGECEGLSIKLRLRTNNAIQKDRDGNAIFPGRGYKVYRDFQAVRLAEQKKSRERVEERQRIIKEREALLALPVVSSFLGAMIGDSLEKYERRNDEVVDMDDGTQLVYACLNQLPNFESTGLLKAFDDDRVIGVVAFSKPHEDDFREEEMQRLRSVFAEKYQRPCAKLDDGTLSMVFHRDELRHLGKYAQLEVSALKDGRIMILFVDTDAFENAQSRFDACKKEQKNKIEESLRKAAIDAL